VFSADAETARYVPVVHRLTREFAQPPGLDDVARSVDLSRYHFHRRFSELIGATPKHLVLDCQIEMAQRHLREGRLSLAEIAVDCGFAHQSHFTARFKQATGLTPTQWLRMAQGSGQGDA
jgi:AraC family transcriptional regulator